MQITPKITFVALTLSAFLALTGCSRKESSSESPTEDAQSEAPNSQHSQELEQIAALYPSASFKESGLAYIVEKEGKGDATPQPGNMVTVHYKGTFLDGKTFDSSIENGRPFSFMVARQQVIPGWDEAFLDMKTGEKRTLILPSKLAYGSRGFPGAIPPNSILVFEVELLDFK